MEFDLSDEAKRALDAEGQSLVLGGPGSGKTTLALLKAQMIIPYFEPGQKVLFLSFSRAAVQQVLARCGDVLTADERRQIKVSTYHSFCLDILRAHGRLLNGRAPRILFPQGAMIRKAGLEGDWDEEQGRLADEESLFTFDQFASSASKILENAECVRRLISDRFPVIILDEFQDTDDSQWALVQQLATNGRLIVLADPDQRIFEYQAGVDPARLDHLRVFAEPEEFDLTGENHRSPNSGILAFADAVLANETLPAPSEVKARDYYPTNFDSTVHTAVVWQFAKLRSEGIESPTIAVLCRSNTMVVQVSKILDSTHSMSGRSYQPVEHMVVWDPELPAASAAVLGSIIEWSSMDAESGVLETLQALTDYYSIKYARNQAANALAAVNKFRNAISALENGKTVRANAAKEIVAARESFDGYVGEPVADWQKAREILKSVDELSEVHDQSRQIRLFRAAEEIGPRLQEEWVSVGAYPNARTIVRRAIENATLVAGHTEPRGVNLMSIHKSKGKEFDGVVIVEGAFSGKLFDQYESPPHPQSRRLLRVAITRARHQVTLVRSHDAVPLVGE